MRSRGVAGVAVVAALLLVAGCSDDEGSGGSVPTAPPVTICDPDAADPQRDDELPDLALIDQAVAALATELGGPAEYFEINVTARLANLFVALNDGTVVQPWVYVDGELSSEEGQAATGGTFLASDLDFDPDTVLSQVRDEVPEAVLESFYAHGDGQGNMLYGVLASARCGGGLDIVVGADGTVKSVDPVS